MTLLVKRKMVTWFCWHFLFNLILLSVLLTWLSIFSISMNDFFLLNFFQFNTNNFQVLDSKIFKFLAINIFHILDINLDYWSWCSSRPDPSRKISIYNSWLSISSRALFSISTIDHGAAHPQGLAPVGHRCRKNWFLRGERWTQRWGMVISSWPIALIFLLVFFRNLHG